MHCAICWRNRSRSRPGSAPAAETTTKKAPGPLQRGGTLDGDKAAGKDAEAGKATLVAVLGIDAAKARLKTLVADAEAALKPFGAKAAVLAEAARFVAERKT